MTWEQRRILESNGFISWRLYKDILVSLYLGVYGVIYIQDYIIPTGVQGLPRLIPRVILPQMTRKEEPK